MHINYRARQYSADLAFLFPEDSLPTCLHTINSYDAVLERSESLANNLGARPLSSMLLQRFERMFDGPPTVVSSTSQDFGATQPITWFDVVEASDAIAADRVTELDDPRDGGKRVVRFEVQDCELQVSWEEWQMVRSGMLQKMMPTQPVGEDEEKELGTLDILEETVGKVVGLADQVAARGRQFNHRLRARRTAIAERRAAAGAVVDVSIPRSLFLVVFVLQRPLCTVPRGEKWSYRRSRRSPLLNASAISPLLPPPPNPYRS